MHEPHPGPERLGAFSDGVIAIIITIMVLDLHTPHENSLGAFLALWPTLLAYVLSYAIVAIVWVNHHHLVHHARRANGPLLWTNLLLLFFVSLIPFFTKWIAEAHLAPIATALYAANFVLTCAAFIAFEHQVAAQLDAADVRLALARRRGNRRNWFALLVYAAASGLALVNPRAALALILLSTLLYILPEAFALGTPPVE